MHKRVNVDILGRQYSIRTDGNEEYIYKIAEYVNAKSREVMQATQTVSTVDVVIKVAINLVDELFQERADKESLLQSVKGETRQLIEVIDTELRNPGGKTE